MRNDAPSGFRAQALTLMITFDTEGRRFDLRAVAVFIAGDHVLLHQMEGDEHWSLPGGRVELGEDAATAVAREMREELNVTVTVGPMLWVVENFFSIGARENHEVGFYFATEAPAGASVLDIEARHFSDEKGRRLEFVWFQRQDLAGVDLRPAFMREALAQEPLRFAHVVNRHPSTDGRSSA
jgi:ADP-ribose pyrophosphatase YjhB (NUDIX family)